jgi:hypothetical protein
MATNVSAVLLPEDTVLDIKGSPLQRLRLGVPACPD